MKKLLLVLIVTLFCIQVHYSLAQENIQEACFHDLKGMEDSVGTTHLFYRQYSRTTQECTYEDYTGEMVTHNLTLTQNNIRHYNTISTSDSVRFQQKSSVWPDCYVREPRIFSYTFYQNNPKKSIIKELEDIGFVSPYIRNWKGNTFYPDFAAPHNIEIDSVKQRMLIPTPLKHIVAKTTDSLNPDHLRSTIAVHPDGSNWDQIKMYEKHPDSLFFDFTILGINPLSNNEYFVVREDSLFYSDDHGKSLSFITANQIFENGEADVFFSSDEQVFYFSFETVSRPVSISKKVRKLSYGQEAWNFEPVKLPGEETVQAFDLEISESVRLFLADSTTIYTSHNHADTFSEFMSFDNTITGLYKKQGSDLLYVLTTEELLEVNVVTDNVTSLKQLPVSSEPKPEEIPVQTELHQNYPNPFNPVTTIQYELPENREVTLEVFDMLGRRVAVLVDEFRQAGIHQASFDASGLSSGIYVYRLTAGNEIQTRQMVLVK